MMRSDELLDLASNLLGQTRRSGRTLLARFPKAKTLIRKLPRANYVPNIPECFIILRFLVLIFGLTAFVLSLDIWVSHYQVRNPWQSRFVITVLASIAAILGMVYAIISECATNRLYVWFVIFGIDKALFFLFFGLTIVWGYQASSPHNILACDPDIQFKDPALWTRLQVLWDDTRSSQIAVCVLCGMMCIMSLTRSISMMFALVKDKVKRKCRSAQGQEEGEQANEEKSAALLPRGQDNNDEKPADPATPPSDQRNPPAEVKKDIAHYNKHKDYESDDHPLRLNPIDPIPKITVEQPTPKAAHTEPRSQV